MYRGTQVRFSSLVSARTSPTQRSTQRSITQISGTVDHKKGSLRILRVFGLYPHSGTTLCSASRDEASSRLDDLHTNRLCPFAKEQGDTLSIVSATNALGNGRADVDRRKLWHRFLVHPLRYRVGHL